MKANWLDRAIAAVAPGAAVKRLAARRAFELSLRRYDAAKSGRRTSGWITGGTSANAEIGPALRRIRERSRDLVRNNPYSANAVRKLSAYMVGKGIKPRITGVSKQAKAQATDTWKEFVDAADPEGVTNFYGLQALISRSVVESGSALVQFLPRPRDFRLQIPLQIRVLEPDHLDLEKTAALEDGGFIHQGIEFDQFGRRRAYWLFDGHPGDVHTLATSRLIAVSRRIPAGQILHVFDRLRPGQVQGVPWFAPVALKQRDLDDYDEAELLRKGTEACFAGIVTKTNAAGDIITGASEVDESGARIETLAPGTVQYLGPDESIAFAEPKAAPGYAEYMSVQLHAIAAGVGMTYEQMTGDLSKVNFSSLRAGKLDFFAALDQWQEFMLLPQLCQPVWRRVDLVAQVLGRRRRSIQVATWAFPARPWHDTREVTAAITQIRGGLKSAPRAIAETGVDLDDHYREIREHNATLDEMGIVLDSDPRQGKSNKEESTEDDSNKEDSGDAEGEEKTED